MKTQEFKHTVQGKEFINFLAYDESLQGKRPTVIVVHAFEGRNQFACDYAEKLAKLGFAGIAVDMYGDKQIATTLDECVGFVMPLINNRADVRERIVAAFDAVKQLDVVDDNKIAAMGFCFGGMTALDLARSGVNVKGVASFHGLLTAPKGLPASKIASKVLIMHGYDDPQVPPEQLLDFTQEMTKAKVDWQAIVYGNTQHAFTDPEADKIGGAKMGRVYNALTTERAWQATQTFFNEIFSS